MLEPSDITLPAWIQKVSILPVPGVPEPPGEFDSLKYIRLGLTTNTKEIKMGYLHGIYDEMIASPRFQKVVLNDTVNYKYLDSGFINWEIIDQICSRDSTDVLLLLLKAVSYDSEESFYVSNGIEYNNNMSVFTIVNHTKWAFYIPGKHIESLVFYNSDTVFAEGGFDVWEVENLLYQTCYGSGFNVGRNICPYWNDGVERIFYRGPGRDLKRAGSMVDENRWNDAALIWNRLSEGPNKNHAARAAYNLALAFERDDMMDQAALWISFADSLHSNKATSFYKKVLKERLDNKVKLDEQLAGN